MTVRVVTAGSTSTNYHLHVVRSEQLGNASVSAGKANERTIAIPVMVQDMRLTVLGTFGSGSASTVMAVDIGPKGSAFINLFSISAPFTTTIPVQVDHVLRFRHTITSAGAAPAGTSVDVWVG